MKVKYIVQTAAVALLIAQSVYADELKQPNVVVVITDDQGYGDVAFTGNPAIKTPNIDKLCKQGTLLINFHVDPTCAPTRSALMTGRYSDRVGVWHTVQGRSMLRRRETTMADVFGANGYATGMFGKWHLGDCYGKAFNYKQARLRIGNIDETKDIPAGAKEVTFKVSLKKGITQLAPVFIGPDLTATPYYAYVTHAAKPGWQTPQGMGIPIYDPSFGRVPQQKKSRSNKK